MRNDLFAPDHFDRSREIWTVITQPFRTDGWYRQADVVRAAEESGCNPVTVRNLITRAIRLGRLERRGRWSGSPRASDTRELRLVRR